jgi:integrase/recombinase XerD
MAITIDRKGAAVNMGNIVRISTLLLASCITTALDGFLVYCESKGLSQNTLIYYRTRIEAFIRFLDERAPGIALKDITRQLIRDFLTEEAKRTSASTANHAVIALRAFFNFLIRDSYLESNPMEGIEKLRQPKRLIQAFSIEQMQSVLNLFGNSFSDVRDRAIIMLLLDSGIRASELCSITLGAISWTEQTILVIGKGDKQRIVPFGQATKQALTKYLLRRGELETDRLFVTVYGEPFDRHRLGRIIKSRCRKAGIEGIRCSPHSMRHTFAVSYLRSGADLFSLQKILGHSDLTMTRRYTELTDSDVVARHKAFSPADRIQPVKKTEGKKRIK